MTFGLAEKYLLSGRRCVHVALTLSARLYSDHFVQFYDSCISLILFHASGSVAFSDFSSSWFASGVDFESCPGFCSGFSPGV